MPTTLTPRKIQQQPLRRSVIGWGGIRFTLPADWNLTAFSMERGGGYLKVDSPGSMFAQVKWFDTRAHKRPANLLGYLLAAARIVRLRSTAAPGPANLRSILDSFLTEAGRQAKKTKTDFDSKIRPENHETKGNRASHSFSWSGDGIGQGKIWHCKTCGRIVIAQIVGRSRDNVGDVVAAMFSSFEDHAEDGWNTWALYDLVVDVPEGFEIRKQKLMSGYLNLEFERNGEKLRIERWGLANVTRKKFTLSEWFHQACGVHKQRIRESTATINGHSGVRATGQIKSVVDWARTIRAALGSFRTAHLYDALIWECDESNKLLSVQSWHTRHSIGQTEEVANRCVCH